jgi:hypothetical protein
MITTTGRAGVVKPGPPAARIAPPREDAMAIVGLTAGSLGVLCGFLGVAGLALSVLALLRIERSGGQLAGRYVALVGVAVSAVTVMAWEVAVVLWLHYGAGVTLPLVDGILPRF